MSCLARSKCPCRGEENEGKRRQEKRVSFTKTCPFLPLQHDLSSALASEITVNKGPLIQPFSVYNLSFNSVNLSPPKLRAERVVSDQCHHVLLKHLLIHRKTMENSKGEAQAHHPQHCAWKIVSARSVSPLLMHTSKTQLYTLASTLSAFARRC